jgi:hypothetical protein
MVQSWSEALVLDSVGAHFGFVQEGRATLFCEQGQFELGPGMYFSVSDAATIRGGRGTVSTRLGWRGLFSIGGPVEEVGRLQYIDGCTDTLLISPVRLGDPCLNLLHIPLGTHQTAHTHPSVRCGVIWSGTGHCLTDDGRWPLAPSVGFVISPETLHCFHTDQEALRVIAWHPDSDFGPTDQDHPMVNRTVIS